MNVKMFASSVLGMACLIVLASPATAYVGPGAGVSLIGSIIGLLLALGTALGVIVLLPLRAMRRRKRKAAEAEAGAAPEPAVE